MAKGKILWSGIICLIPLGVFASAQVDTKFFETYSTSDPNAAVELSRWVQDTPSLATLTLESGRALDGNLMDAAGDGYAVLRSTMTSGKAYVSISRTVGVIDSHDVGAVLRVRFAVFTESLASNLMMESALLIGGTESVLGSHSTFPGGNGSSGEIVMEHEIVSADVGKEIGVIFKFWDSTLGLRSAGIDAFSVEVVRLVNLSLILLTN